jgi:hypothetical protein
MADAFKKVQSGQPLAIPAAAFNAFLDAADDLRRRQQSRHQDSQPHWPQAGIVRVKNASGTARERFEILGVDRPIFTPTDNLATFQNEVLLVGVQPVLEDHAGRFVVLLEPLGAGQIGRAVISGVCPVKLLVTEESDTFAEIEDGNCHALKSAGSGSATILWKEPGTGADKWAVIRLGSVKPVIRKAEMIDMLQQGDTGPARAWLLEFDGTGWIRTDKQIDLYGDQGFRGVAFGRTEAVNAGDKIDVYYSLEALQWYGVVGGWYFHGNVVADIAVGQAGQVKLNVGAGGDAREITVEAFSPYTAVKKDDFVAVNWNTFSVHWDIEKISTVELGCGLKRDEDDKLIVDKNVLAGPGLIPFEDCGLAVGAGCGIVVEPDAVRIDAAAIAGPGLVGSTCQVSVLPGCGITVGATGVRFQPTDVAGPGLVADGTCGLRVLAGCGLTFFGNLLDVNPHDLAGEGLVAESPCRLALDTDPVSAYTFSAVTNVQLSIAGCTLTLTKTVTPFDLLTNAAGVVVGFEAGTPFTTQQTVDLCACRPEYDCYPS